MDVTNYALTEMDYKLGFDIQDYLTTSNGKLPLEIYGLFAPKKIYPIAPVTCDDYRKLLYAHFPTLHNIYVNSDRTTGNFDIKVTLSPFDGGQDILKQIRECFHAHRNRLSDYSQCRIGSARPMVTPSFWYARTI